MLSSLLLRVRFSDSESLLTQSSNYFLTPARYLLGGRDVCVFRSVSNEDGKRKLDKVSSESFSQQGERSWIKCAQMLIASPLSILGAVIRLIDFYTNRDVFHEIASTNDSTNLKQLHDLFFGDHLDAIGLFSDPNALPRPYSKTTLPLPAREINSENLPTENGVFSKRITIIDSSLQGKVNNEIYISYRSYSLLDITKIDYTSNCHDFPVGKELDALKLFIKI